MVTACVPPGVAESSRTGYDGPVRPIRFLKLALLLFLGLILLGGWLAAGREGSLEPPSTLAMILISVGVVGALLTALAAWLCSD